jgi:hypothetical protein
MRRRGTSAFDHFAGRSPDIRLDQEINCRRDDWRRHNTKQLSAYELLKIFAKSMAAGFERAYGRELQKKTKEQKKEMKKSAKQ